MPDQFMGNTPVTDKLDGDVEVFQHGLMAPLDDASHKGGGAGVGDFVLGLIAHPATQLNVLEDGFAVQGREDFKTGRDDFHVDASLMLVSYNLYAGFDSLDELRNLIVGYVVIQGNTQTGPGLPLGVAHGTEHIGWLACPRATR